MPPTTVQLSTRLREETKAAHTRAERSGIMRDLLRGILPLDRYLALHANLHHVYAVLEAELRSHATHPAVAPIHDPALERTAALADDLAVIAGSDWPEAHPTLPAAHAYADRIAAAAAEDPALLVAHSYTRYLGDLSGGQMLRRFAAKLLPAGEQQALAFYDFPTIPDPKAYKEGYRSALDALPLTEAQADRIVAEALVAFELNGALFEALG